MGRFVERKAYKFINIQKQKSNIQIIRFKKVETYILYRKKFGTSGER
jgi:hypothetical protein